MAADATTARHRPASLASARIALAAAGLAVAMFGVCGVLLLLTRNYQRAAYGAGGTVTARVCLAVGFVVARGDDPPRPPRVGMALAAVGVPGRLGHVHRHPGRRAGAGHRAASAADRTVRRPAGGAACRSGSRSRPLSVRAAVRVARLR